MNWNVALSSFGSIPHSSVSFSEMSVGLIGRLRIIGRASTCYVLQSRSLYKKPKGFLSSLLGSENKPPFDHVVQVGDPVLRVQAQDVDLRRLSSAQIQFLLRTLKKNLENYDAVGVSAPQIGVPLKVFAIQVTERQISRWSPEAISKRNILPVPFKFFINPDLKIVNSELVVDIEGCCSVNGFSALVPRAKEVQVRAFDENGQPFTFAAKDWTARILQHEMDHLKGSSTSLRSSTWPISALCIWITKCHCLFLVWFQTLSASSRFHYSLSFWLKHAIFFVSHWECIVSKVSGSISRIDRPVFEAPNSSCLLL